MNDPFDIVFYCMIVCGLVLLGYLAVQADALCPAYHCIPEGWGAP